MNRRIDIASIRREQIVEAAIAVISEKGLQNLSLSAIEGRTGMSRGQLTYYYRTKEEILLAVFDRLLDVMCRRFEQPGENGADPFDKLPWTEVVRLLLQMVLQQPPAHPEFHCLQYTFLSQIGHRQDFRKRLASLYEEWRQKMAEHLARDLEQRPAVRQAAPRTVATLVQALLHGLAMQSAADPGALNSAELVDLCLDMLGSYLWQRSAAPAPARAQAGRNGHEKTRSRGKSRRKSDA